MVNWMIPFLSGITTPQVNDNPLDFSILSPQKSMVGRLIGFVSFLEGILPHEPDRYPLSPLFRRI